MPDTSAAICVFCSARDDVAPVYRDAAACLGRLIGAGGSTLVYGGGAIGLMGIVARQVHGGGGRVVGVIPHSMVRQEIVYTKADELVVTQTMRQRKQIMERRSDAFVALPGGFGTLEELLEILTLRQLAMHDKPVVIINVGGYYDPLLDLFEHLFEQRFANPKHRRSYRVVTEPDTALDGLIQ